jgi:hypothetical protein
MCGRRLVRGNGSAASTDRGVDCGAKPLPAPTGAGNSATHTSREIDFVREYTWLTYESSP